MAVLAGMLALVLATPISAAADSGVTRERIRFEVEGAANDDLSAACGVPVIVDSTFNIHIVEFADGRSKIHINSRSTLSSPYADVRTIGTSMIQFEPEQVVDNGDGTLTVLIPHRESISFVNLIAGGNVADAGIIDWEIRLVIDAATGELLNEDEVVVQTTGHFPVFSGEGGALSLLCEALKL
ncbi:MAG: hypothetical protein OES24_05885 [Acidimicrobiia bacterium]|nr:hypothetical protein [Acidimicrobiia bacterium]